MKTALVLHPSWFSGCGVEHLEMPVLLYVLAEVLDFINLVDRILQFFGIHLYRVTRERLLKGRPTTNTGMNQSVVKKIVIPLEFTEIGPDGGKGIVCSE